MVMGDGSEPHINGLITFSQWGWVGGVRNQSTREGRVFLMKLMCGTLMNGAFPHMAVIQRQGEHLLFLLSLSFQLSFRSVSATVDTKREQVGSSPFKKF